MALTTLQAIRTKVRNITRSPSINQLSDAKLDDYINTFILYDFPENIRLFSLRSVFTFYTQPNVDVYETNTTDINNPLYNFKNRVEAIHEPVYLAGIQSMYTQKRDVFYGYYPQTNNVASTLVVGNGTVGPYTGTLTAVPILQNNVSFSVIDAAGNAMTLVDIPTSPILGVLASSNTNPISLTNPIRGRINYITGAWSIGVLPDLGFPAAAVVGSPIMASTIPYQAGKPITMLYYDTKFTLRPVPDKVYTVQFEVDLRPTELLASIDIPQFEQWWQYIAVMSSIKVFEDRFDFDSIQKLMPTALEYEVKMLRNTLTQQANERTLTIYTQGKQMGFGWLGAGGWPY